MEQVMDSAWALAGWGSFFLLIFIGLVLNALGLFGNWIILLAAVLAWLFTGFEHFGIWSFVLLGGLAAIGEIAEALASGFGAARFGGTKRTAVASIVGAILGAMAGSPLFPIIGTLIGACIGAFAGAVLYEYIQMEKGFGDASYTGFGAALGEIGGVLAKVLVGFVMLVSMYFLY